MNATNTVHGYWQNEVNLLRKIDVNIKIVELPLDAGADPSTPDYFGRNAFHWACQYGRKNVAD